MSLFAVLPVKSLAAVKSRLGSSLSGPERSVLAREMLTRSATAVLRSGVVTRCVVVSPDPAVLALALSLGAYPLLQRSGGLNEALDQGRAWARVQGAADLLILLPDLPLLQEAEVASLAVLAAPGTAVLAPDRHGSGTNGLLLAADLPFQFSYGAGSLRLHAAEASRLGLTVRLFTSIGTQFDIDTPLDLRDWQTLTEEARIA